MKLLMRKLHRWLGLAMAIQIVAWMASGLYFSLVPIEEIRGEHLTRPPVPIRPEALDRIALPARVKKTVDRSFGPDWTLDKLDPVDRGGVPLWRIQGSAAGKSFTRLLNEQGTQLLPQLSAEQARRAAVGLLLKPAEPVSVERLEAGTPGGEYRNRVLPVWKVSFDQPESLNLYLDPWTGELLVRRTARWRIFDFFWMLHIMDFDEREDFNHPVLQLAAFLGLVISLSGVLLWALTTRIFRKPSRTLGNGA